MTRTAMNFDKARAVKRTTIRVGRRYEFYATILQEHLPPGGTSDKARLRDYTGQRVLVIEQTFHPRHPQWVPGESERVYLVRAEDGREFEAYQGELNGWFKDTEQFYGPSGIFGKET